MSRLRDLLGDVPVAVPTELEQAWDWMEEQGYATDNSNGYYLTPYAGTRQLGVVFTDQADLTAWLPDDADIDQFSTRLVPIAEVDGSGSMAALWADDDDRVRVVALTSEGQAYVLADSSLDFLRLCAVGYPELTEIELGLEPDNQESIAAVADFRDWVSATFDVEVPTEWPPVGEDEFTDWMNARLGIEPERQAEIETGPGTIDATAIGGDAVVLLNALGVPGGVDRIAELLEVPDTKSRTLTKVGVEMTLHRKAPETVWVTLFARPRKPAYSRGDTLFGSIAPGSSPDDVIAALGEPERRGEVAPGTLLVPGTDIELTPEVWLRYQVLTDAGPRYLRLGFGDEGLQAATFMDPTDWPEVR